jgi:hypothetical protein
MRVTSVPGPQPRWVRQKKLTNWAGVICGKPLGGDVGRGDRVQGLAAH